MLVVIITLLTIAVMRLHSDSFKQSLFENFTKNYRNTIEFCSLFSLLNIYMYTLAYVYSPAKNASIGKLFTFFYFWEKLKFVQNQIILAIQPLQC